MALLTAEAFDESTDFITFGDFAGGNEVLKEEGAWRLSKIIPDHELARQTQKHGLLLRSAEVGVANAIPLQLDMNTFSFEMFVMRLSAIAFTHIDSLSDAGTRQISSCISVACCTISRRLRLLVACNRYGPVNGFAVN